MPNCFHLIRKSDQKSGPVELRIVDEEMRKHFNQPPHLCNWLGGWYQSIGFRLALGWRFEQIKADFLESIQKNVISGDVKAVQAYQGLIRITDWLSDNFVSDSWAQVGRGS